MAKAIAQYQHPFHAHRRRYSALNGQSLVIRIIVGLVFVLAVASAVAIYFGQEDQFRRIEIRAEQLKREQAITDQRYQEQADLQTKVATDAYIEHVARNKLGLVKPNEVIFEDP